jgi:hypothetical protein
MESSPQQQHFMFVTIPGAVSGHCRLFPSLASPDAEAVDASGVLHVPYSDGFDDGYLGFGPLFLVCVGR